MNTPRCAFKFVNNHKVTNFFKRRWMALWACNSTVGDLYYQGEKWRVWRFMGGM